MIICSLNCFPIRAEIVIKADVAVLTSLLIANLNRAMIVKRCKITKDMLSNSLMVAKHAHKQLRFILRPLKIVHHSCEYTKTLQDVLTCTNVRALQCVNLDHIRSRLNTVHVHYFEET